MPLGKAQNAQNLLKNLRGSEHPSELRVLIDTQRNWPGENVTDNITSNQRERKILFFIENHPGCSSGEISSKLDLALPTVKKDLSKLVERKLIYKEGVGRGNAYFLV